MSFSLDIAKFAEKAGANAGLVVKKVATDMFSRIVFRTPVDTGRARGNWQVSFGSPATGVTNNQDSSKLDTGSSLSSMVSAFESLNGKVIYSWKSGDIWLSNNLPYIGKLEYGTYGKGPGATEKTGGSGYSVQAPQGMVRITMREYEGYVRKAVEELDK